MHATTFAKHAFAHTMDLRVYTLDVSPSTPHGTHFTALMKVRWDTPAHGGRSTFIRSTTLSHI